MSTLIDISKLNKTELLKQLWMKQTVAGFFRINNITPLSFDDEKAKTAITDYIDYFSGRAIKTDLSKDTVDPYMFDRDAGRGTFAKIVEKMKKELE